MRQVHCNRNNENMFIEGTTDDDDQAYQWGNFVTHRITYLILTYLFPSRYKLLSFVSPVKDNQSIVSNLFSLRSRASRLTSCCSMEGWMKSMLFPPSLKTFILFKWPVPLNFRPPNDLEPESVTWNVEIGNSHTQCGKEERFTQKQCWI